jgi:hypothetical protein
LPAGYALALQRDPAISASMPPSLAVGPRSSTELTASRGGFRTHYRNCRSCCHSCCGERKNTGC